jgi:MFS family permease
MKPFNPRLARHLALLLSLYVTQYLGPSFIMEALIAILRKGGMPLERLGFVYLLGLFWGIKFLWAPVMDRFSIPRIGHFKGWLLALQALLTVSLLVVAGFDPENGYLTVFLLCMLVSFFSASQDIAADALAYRLLADHERGYGNAVKIGGGLIGYMLGGGVALILFARIGWASTLLVLAATTCLSLLQVIFLREPDPAPVRQETSGYLQRFHAYWTADGRRRWLLLLVLYPLGICIAYSMIIPMLVDAGWTLERIGFAVNIIGALVGAMAAMGSGWLIRRFGRRPMLVGMAFAQGTGILLMLLPASGRHDIFSVCLAVGALLFLYSPSTTVVSTLMMDHTGDASPATDLAMQHGLYQLVGFVAGAAGMAFAGTFGYRAAVCTASGLAFLSVIASLKLYAPRGRFAESSQTPVPALDEREVYEH